MISAILIEDDHTSAQQLMSILPQLSMDIEIKTQLRSVQEAMNYFNENNVCDLIISDIQLRDGLSFSIFENMTNCCPVIFISAYDRFLVKTLENFGIDFIPKPVNSTALDKSIQKYKAFSDHFRSHTLLPQHSFQNLMATRKSRILAKKGAVTMSLLLSDIVLFYTEAMIVYAVDNKGIKYFVDKSLNSLEEDLNPQEFFRANRQFILNIKYIEGYKMYERVKLLVQLNLKSIDYTLVIAQEKARAFKTWLSDA